MVELSATLAPPSFSSTLPVTALIAEPSVLNVADTMSGVVALEEDVVVKVTCKGVAHCLPHEFTAYTFTGSRSHCSQAVSDI